MRKGWNYLVLLAGGIVVAVVGVVLLRPHREPEFAGKRLSEWVRRFAILDLRFAIGDNGEEIVPACV